MKKGDVANESGKPLPTSGRKKHERKKKKANVEGGKGIKRAAEEEEESSSEEEEVQKKKEPAADAAAANKKRKISAKAKEDGSASDSDDSLPPPAFGTKPRTAANGPHAFESTAAVSTSAAPPGPSTKISTTAATRGSETSASQRLESVNARHPPSVGAVLRTVRPLQALTGVSTTELARLTQDVRRIGDEVEIAAVQAVIGGSPSSKKHKGGRGGQQTNDDSIREEGGIFGGGNARHRAVTAVVIAFAIAIDILVLSELLHVLGGMFIAGTAASVLTTDPPSSLLARSIHASLAPRARRPSQRVYDHTKLLGTSLVASMEGLLSTSHHDTEAKEERHHPNIRPPRRSSSSPSIMERAELYVTHRLMGLTEPVTTTASDANDAYEKAPLSNLTLREFIANDEGFHLAMAPAFFGFYAYFGALSALNEEVLGKNDEGKVVLPTEANLARFPADGPEPNVLLKSVAGASAGAMAAVFLSAGADPRDAADTCLDLTFGEVADYGGFGAALKGHRFEAIMKEKLEKIGRTSRFDESVLPVAVSGFDLLSMSGRLLDDGCMAKAARASATFPGLFQPVGWNSENDDDESKMLPEHLLIDGGIRDLFGLNGLSILSPEKPKRILNMVVGSFGSITPGPSLMPKGIKATEVVSISLQNLPKCGPWAMENGPIAVEASRKAIAAVLDAPMHVGSESGHYELHVDAIDFV